MSTENGASGLQVVVSPWKLYIQAWLQKLLSVVISAKVLVTMLVLWLTYYLATTHHVIQQVAGTEAVELEIAYINGEQIKTILVTTISTFLGARVAVPIIEAVGTAVVRAKNGK